MKNKARRLWICFFILIFILIIIITALGLSFISKKPIPFYSDNINFNALNSANTKIQKEFNFLTGSLVKSNSPRSISFSSDEVNALLAMSVTSAQTFSSGNKVFSDMVIYFENGIFYFNASKKLKFYTPFGRYINLLCNFKFKLKDKIIDFHVLDLKVGKIVLPEFVVDFFVNRRKDGIYAIPAVQRLLQSIKEVNVYENKIVVIYYPKNLMTELNSFLGSQNIGIK